MLVIPFIWGEGGIYKHLSLGSSQAFFSTEPQELLQKIPRVRAGYRQHFLYWRRDTPATLFPPHTKVSNSRRRGKMQELCDAAGLA